MFTATWLGLFALKWPPVYMKKPRTATATISAPTMNARNGVPFGPLSAISHTPLNYPFDNGRSAGRVPPWGLPLASAPQNRHALGHAAGEGGKMGIQGVDHVENNCGRGRGRGYLVDSG